MTVDPSLGIALSKPPTAVNLRRVFTLLTQAHFSAPENYGYLKSELEDVKWSADPKERTLYIGLQHDFDPRAATTALPAIYFGFGDSDFEQEVVSNEAELNADNSAVVSVVNARASLQWVCMARTADFAGNLAETCFSFFSSGREFLMSRLNLRTFLLAQMSMPTQVRAEGKEPYYRVDVRGTLHYNHTLTIHTESHRLKKVAIIPTPETGSDVETDIS